MLRLSHHILFSALLGAGLMASIGCGDDDTKGTTNCGPGTIEQNGQCVAAPQDATVAPETTPATDTAPQPDTTPATDTAPQPDTAPPAEVTPEVVNECTPETAGKGKIGSPCTKDCECGDDHGETTCYNGFYMEGFRFCTHESDGRSSNNEDVGYATLQFPSDCYPDLTPPQRPPIYSAICKDLDHCKALGAAYTRCGTAGLPYHAGGAGTQCPVPNSNNTLTLWKTCIIDTLPPFDGSEIE